MWTLLFHIHIYFQHDATQNPLFIHPEGASFKNCIQLGACQIDQSLPMHPDLPADLFTSCLTTPIKMAARWYNITMIMSIIV